MPDRPGGQVQAASRAGKFKRWTLRGLMVLLLIAIAAEIYLRVVMGMGDPPLIMADPQIEYLAQPSKVYSRFGHRVAYNQWSMRSDDFPKTKANPDELRIMVLGDSVVNGGGQTDQANLATEIVKREVQAKHRGPVVVGNISASSWGPPNLLAYIKRFGFFDADVIIIVLSSHDAADAPTFGPLGIDAPTSKPLLALQEAAQRVLPRLLPTSLGGNSADPPRSEAKLQADRDVSLAALTELLAMARETKARTVVFQHLERTEVQQKQAQRGHDDIAGVVDAENVDRVELGPLFAKAIADGHNPYRDNIHPNDAGQRIIASAIMDWLKHIAPPESAP